MQFNVYEDMLNTEFTNTTGLYTCIKDLFKIIQGK